jgi:integrase
MAKRLTDIGIRNLKPGAVRREISDHANGLFLISQSSGARSWAVRYRYAGKSIKLTVGQWPATSLVDARKAAADAQHALARGENPAKAKVDAKIKADAAKADTVTAICERYLAFEGKRLRTVDQRISTLRRLVYPTLGAMPIETVKRSDIVRLLDKIEVGSGPRMADVTLAVLRRIFHWHETRTDDFRSPIIRGMGSRQNTVEHRRSRILSDDEIRAVWAATADGQPFSALIRLALLTSARRNEIAGMKRDEIDGDGIWTLPAARSKTKTEVVRPLSAAALAVLDGLPHIDGCPYPFTSNRGRPINNFSDPKRLLDERSGVTGWTVHDTRRTARSLMSRAGVDVDVAERLLGHSRGDLRERYDRHSFVPQMTRAVEILSALVARIVNPPEGEVADMAAERSKRRRR